MRSTWFKHDKIPQYKVPTHLDGYFTKHFLRTAYDSGIKIYFYEMTEQEYYRLREKPRISYYVVHNNLEYDLDEFVDFIAKRCKYLSCDFLIENKVVHDKIMEEYNESLFRIQKRKVAEKLMR